MKTRLRQVISCTLLYVLLFSPLLAQNYLYVTNPQFTWEESIGVINEATISVKPAGMYTEIGLFLTLSTQDQVFSPESQLEIVYDFALPKNSIVNDSWLWVEDSIVRADIRDRWSASFIYEGIVQRRQDPSILYKLYEHDSQPVYELRVYPLFQEDVRKVKISYLVPTSFTLSGQQIPLPMEMLAASGITPDQIRLLVWPDEDWTNPTIQEHGNILFENKETEEGVPYLETELSEYHGQNLSLHFPSVLQEGIYLKTYETPEDNYYQLVYLPTLDEDLQTPSKLTFVLDYVRGYTSINRETYLTETTQFLLANLNPTDSFNIVYPTLTVNQASNSWLSATEENISAVMETVRDRLNSEFSLLPSLLNAAFAFSQEDESANIFLISSSDEFETINKANTIVESLQETYDRFPTVFIADLADEPRYAFWSGGVSYYGNQYLYTLLTQLSGGEISSLFGNSSTTMNEVLQNSLGQMSGRFESFDLHTSVASGFCYSRLNLTSLSQVSPSSSIKQVGKYVGELPFEMSVAGEFQDSLFYKEYTLFPFSEETALDSLSKSIWAGLQIREWEEESSTNEMVQRIIALSLENRVLSEYTAFLALEPSDTTFACPTNECEDESVLPVSLSEQLEADLSISLAPNPFTDIITISGNVLSGKPLTTLKVIDMLGREVKVLMVELSGDKWEASWDGRDPSGSLVSAGIYLLRIEVEGQVISKRLIKQ